MGSWQGLDDVNYLGNITKELVRPKGDQVE